MKITPRLAGLIFEVKAHAYNNYEQGWDVIVECYEDADLAGLIGRARTAKSAISRVGAVVKVVADRRAEHTAEIIAAAGCTTYSECAECLSGKICIDRCAHCNGTNSTPCPRHDLEPDGSIVTARHAYDGELVSLTRTWPGKVGSSSILVEWYGDGDAPESYTPGWRGVIIDSNFCDFDASVPF